MTRMKLDGEPVMRATRGRYRGKEIAVGITPTGIIVGEVGQRRTSYYAIDAEVLIEVGGKLRALEARKEAAAKKAAKKSAPRRTRGGGW